MNNMGPKKDTKKDTESGADQGQPKVDDHDTQIAELLQRLGDVEAAMDNACVQQVRQDNWLLKLKVQQMKQGK